MECLDPAMPDVVTLDCLLYEPIKLFSLVYVFFFFLELD